MWTANGYQYEAAATIARGDGRVMTREEKLANFTMGLAGEAGEVIDLLKKDLFHGKPVDREKLVKELGDVAWYMAAIATVEGIDLDEVLGENIRKLRERHKGGAFTGEYHRDV